ncbi:MAG: NAD-dependent epimerase/dehydratase family protein [Saprospiraceae bacterium]
MNKASHILITGASGFVGRHLIRALKEHGLSNLTGLYHSACPEIMDIRWHKVDLRDPDSLEEVILNVDTVIHLAALVSYDRKDTTALRKVNYYGTRDLVNICLQQGVRRLIYLSSASTLTRSANPLLVGNLLPGRPIFHSHYARSKYLGELEVIRGSAEGLWTCILNPTLILGADNWMHGSNRVIREIAAGMPYYPTGNLAVTSLDTVIAALIRAILEDIDCGPQLIYDSTMSYRQLFEMTCRQAGIGMPHRSLTPLLTLAHHTIQTLKTAISGKRPFVTPEAAKIASLPFTYVRSEQDLFNPAPNLDPELLIREVLNYNN